MRITVVYALPFVQQEIELSLPEGSTVADAIRGLSAQIHEVTPTPDSLGVWGKIVDAEFVLREGDRVEIYRPLIVDPKDARRRRAAKKKRAA